MESKQVDLLKFINYKNLTSWDIKKFLIDKSIFSNELKLRPFGYFLKKANISWTNIENDKEYQILGVRSYGHGAYVNRTVKGDTLKMRRYQVAKSNHLFWCKVDTKNGAFGVIDETTKYGVASSNMTFAEIDINRICPDFLQLVFKNKRINAYMDKYITGSTNRKYILLHVLFNDVEIPLPSIKQQNDIVAAYQAKINLANEQEAKAEELEKEIERYLLEALGVEPLKKVKRKFQELQFINSKNINRWGVEFNLYARLEKEIFKSSKYDNVSIQKYFKINPTIPFSELSQFDEISFIPMETVSDKKGIVKEKRTIEPQQGYTRFSEGNIIWARITPCMENGKCAIVNNLKNGLGIGSTEFHVLKRIKEGFNIKLLHQMLRSELLTANARFYFTGSAGQQRVPKEFLENLYIPLPPLETQETIVAHIDNIKAEIAALRSSAADNRAEALADFERVLFVD